MIQRKLRVGMVGGGGPANFFGAPHRRAILIDNSAELTAGALRSDPTESIASARELFMPRGYPDWQTMMRAESGLPEAERIDYVTIVTPNDAHFGPADAAAVAGNWRAEKPPTTTSMKHAGCTRKCPRQERALYRRPHLHRFSDGDAGPRARARR